MEREMNMTKPDAGRLVVRDLYVSFGERKVLEGISFDLQEGEVCGLLGPNGSGKSTLLGAVAGIGRKDKGEILAEGRNIVDMSRREIAKKIAVVPQQTVFTMPFTVREMVLMGRYPSVGRFGRMSDEDRNVVERALDMVDLPGFEERLTTELSGGEAQRVAVARALAQETKILLLDEPTSALDPKHAISVFSLMRRKRDRGSAILMALHDINSALQWCDRILFLKKGRLVDVRKPERVDAPLLASVFEVGWDMHALSGGGTVAFPKA
jgi:iron complex transport system ATP-binding protein